jgi:hypothetical protein
MARGRKARTGSLKSIRANLPTAYSDALANERMRVKNQATLKYGGGAGRAFLYGFTKGLVGESAASSIANTFRNKDKTERAYSKLTQSFSQQPNKTPDIKSAGSSENTLLLEKISAKLDEVALKVERIDGRLSPRNLTVGKGESQQTFRYDPLAPEGKKVTAVTMSGKSGRFASKKESASVLSKAAYLSNELQEQSTAEQITTETAKKIVEELKKEVAAPTSKPSTPMTYSDVLADEKRDRRAESTLRYGGRNPGRAFLYGFTKGLIGESAADAIAQRFRNKKQTEEAYQQLAGPAIVDTVPNVSVPDMNPTPTAPTQTATQAGAADEKQQFIQAEKVEAEEEFRQEIMKKLDEILEKINAIECDGGGGMIPIPGGPRTPRTRGNRRRNRRGERGRRPGRNPRPPRPPGPSGGGRLAGAAKFAGGAAVVAGAGFGIYDELQGNRKETMEGLDFIDPISYGRFIGDKLNKGYEYLAGEELGTTIWKALNPEQAKMMEEARKRDLNPQPQPDQGPKLPPGMDPESPEAEKFYEDYYSPKGGPVDQLMQQQNELDKNVQENLTQTQMPMAPTVINNTTQVPVPVPKSSGGTGLNAIQVRNSEPSVATYIASIFDHPVTHPGIYKM